MSPTVAVHRSFLDAMAEFAAEGRGGPDDDTMVGWEIRTYAAQWSGRDAFAAFVADLRADSLETTPRPPGTVACTTLWWTEGRNYLGRIAIRHRLTPRLEQVGGHIGYDVRPSARRRGHGTAMLAAALPVAAHLGISDALLTCDVVNAASRRVIEAKGGTLAGEGDGKLRYWVPTGRQPP